MFVPFFITCVINIDSCATFRKESTYTLADEKLKVKNGSTDKYVVNGFEIHLDPRKRALAREADGMDHEIIKR